ncbi:hypothetical protein [uncultured Clostridium sp.]|uniref:hypothetical protein n=1 Tax=uncultured Clostridium sp. TaxID=59620 RepID=UPI0028EE8241|nr:hypothetical protein [uncultured Clostridium sp.]
MHDSFLMQNISREIKEICEANNLKRVIFMELAVSKGSHITEENLLEHLKDLNDDVINEDTEIKVKYESMEELTAVIKKIAGNKIG